MQFVHVENNSPHFKFKVGESPKPYFRPFYIHKWPKDLPSECQICGTEFRVGINLQIGRNRFCRFLGKAAFVSFLPSLLSPFVVEYFFPGIFEGFSDKRRTQLVFAMMFFPPPILWILSSIGPITRHVTCLQCNWNQDFTSLKASLKMKKQDSI